jgi:hypothetical protein
MGIIPAKQFAVAVMINMDGVNAQSLVNTVSEIYGMVPPRPR